MDNRQYNKKKVSFSDTFNDGPVAYLPFQTFLHIVHRLFQAAVHDPRIMLRHACGGMSEHDGHVLQGTLLASVTVVPKVCLATCVVRFFFMPQKSAISLR